MPGAKALSCLWALFVSTDLLQLLFRVFCCCILELSRTSLYSPKETTNTRQVGVISYAEPERCLGECFAHDPGLIRRSSDGVYFRFNTDTYIDIMRSDSLSGPWETVGNVLPEGTVVDLPDVTALWVCEYFTSSAP